MLTIGQKIVFCEGGPGSADVSMIQHAVAAPDVLVRPVGSKWSISAFVRGITADTDKAFLLVRDPDFDMDPPASPPPHLQRFAEDPPTYVWSRNEIENFLVTGELMLPACEAARTSWRPDLGLPPRNAEAIDELIADAARGIVHYEAARWALARIRPTDELPRVRTDWLAERQIPDDAGVDAMRAAVANEIERFEHMCAPISVGRALDLFDDYRERFEPAAFWDAAEHQRWFSGKDLLCALLGELGLPGGMFGEFVDKAVAAFCVLPGTELPPDFAELRELAANLGADT